MAHQTLAMANAMNSVKELRRLGLKATLPRVKVLDVLRGRLGSHLSAEDVSKLLIDQGHKIHLGTVYRVLAQLDNVGAISRQVFDSHKSVYEINSGAHHDHLICVKCGCIREFDDKLIAERQLEIATNNGFSLAEHTQTLYGYCPDCFGASVQTDLKQRVR